MATLRRAATEFVRPCWYRAFVDNRPEGFRVRSASDLDDLCDGLAELQREACMTAASVIGPPDPAAQLAICARLQRPADAVSCVRGTKVQNLLGQPTGYEWLGRTLSVLTDGEFERTGCSELARADPRAACVAGAHTMDEALVTFS